MTEEQLQRQIVDWLRVSQPEGLWLTAANPIPGKTKAAAGRSKAMGLVAGTPDFIGVYRGRFVGIELKLPTKYPTPVQRECMDAITRAGGVTTVVRSLPEFVDFLDVLGVQHRAKGAA